MTNLFLPVIDVSALADALANASVPANSAPDRAKSSNKEPVSTLVVLDVRSADDFATGHIDGAHRLDPGLLNHSIPPISGLLPAAAEVSDWTSQLGLQPDSTIVVYDAGKSTAAARALWVLNVYGFAKVQWLNGGIAAWVAGGHAMTTDSTPMPATTPKLSLRANTDLVLTNEQLKARFADAADANGPAGTTQLPDHQIIDARSSGEYDGSDVRSARGGRMPGAVHYEWLDMLQSDGTLHPEPTLLAALKQRDLRKDVPAVVYCQSHQRSSLTYVVLKHLGFEQVAALDGAWSNWGNDPTTPIDT